MKIWIPFWLVTGFIFVILVLRNAEVMTLAGFILFAALVASAIVFRDPLRLWFTRKLGEWRNDLKQLGLWTRLAFQRDRDAQATATMTHQMSFLQGRLLSPMNLFAVAAVSVLLVPVTFAAQQWRIDRVKHQRDAECSQRELSQDNEGRYRTTRQACADLGEQIAAALDWRTRAIEAEAARIRDIAQIREEQELARRAERERAARVAASSARQRRRQDEAIVAALGGPSPDLDRSLCELAGNSSCGPTDNASPAGEPAASPAVPAGSPADPANGSAGPAAGSDAPA